jgi:hypothetical protein
MKYELFVLEEYITVIIRPEKEFISVATSDILNKHLNCITGEKERITRQIRDNVINASAQHLLNIYIEQHQVSLIELNAVVYTFLHEKSIEKAPKLSSFYDRVANVLEYLLFFIEHHFSAYLNKNMQLSQTSQLALKEEIVSILKLIYTKDKVTQIDDVLFKIAIHHLEVFAANPKNNLNHRNAEYLKQLAVDILNFFSLADYLITNGYFVDHLISICFNSTSFFYFYTNKIEAELEELYSLTEKAEFLIRKIKKITQLSPKSEMALHPDIPGIREQLLNWLEEEKNYIHSKLELAKNLGAAHIEQGINTKLQTSFSVAQLACFIRLLVDGKIITNSNQTEVLKFVTEHFRTDKRESIAFESLRTKYYNIEPSSSAAVKDWLFKLINHLRDL